MTNSPESVQLSRVLPSTLTAYHDFVRVVLEQLEKFGWPDEQLFGVHMALEESISNAVRHGNKHDPEKLVHVDCELSPSVFSARICDEGAGYDPQAVPDCCQTENLEIPGGRGLALIRAYMDSVEHSNQGRCVTITKYLHRASPRE
jgi:serine/threonine-protein kinase RsbW